MKKPLHIIGTATLLLSLLLGLAACSSPTPGPTTPVTLNYSPSISDTDLKTAITQAVIERNWIIQSESPGRMDISYKGYPSTVTYGNGKISISDSGLHRRTHNWANNLRLSIQSALSAINK